MSLSSSLYLAGNTLQATQIGLQVVGQNIANANTPGYSREEVNYTTGGTQRVGGLLLGLGVNVAGIQQQVDGFVEERLRSANSDVASGQTQSDTYTQLEGILNELNGTGLSTSLNDFFSSVNDVLNQPQDLSVRNLAVLKGQSLAGDVNNLAKQANQLRSDLNKQVTSSADDINRLTSQIRDLNVKIATAEGSDLSKSDAVGLRDQRNAALTDLSKIVNIRVEEQPNGTDSVFVGGDYLVFEGQSRAVKAQQMTDRGQTISQIQLVQTNSPLEVSSGQLAGLYTARDKVLGGFLDQMDSFAKTLSFEFNKVYASGQGINGYSTVKSQFSVSDPTAALDAAGLPNAPVNGSFDVQVYNTKTGLTQTTTINVDLNGLDHDTSLNDLATQLNAVSGVSATVSATGQLQINSTSPDQQLAFANDTSNTLAALGINTFFTGSTALSLAVNQDVVTDPGKFAASKGGIGEDTANAVDLTAFLDRKLDSQNGASINDIYGKIVGDVTQASAVAQSTSNGYQTYQQALQGQSSAISGVNLDEEAIKMISLQRAYQASAKYISTINSLLDILVQL